MTRQQENSPKIASGLQVERLGSSQPGAEKSSSAAYNQRLTFTKIARLFIQPCMQQTHYRNDTMKYLSLLAAAFMAVSTHASAAEEVKVEIHLDGERQQTFTLAGPNATVKYLPSLYPNTTLEFRLLAPEPLILEVKEMATDSGAVAAVGKVKLVQTGSSFAMSEIKGAKFRTTYSLVRAN